MHLFSGEHLVASSGIVGAAGPVAAGFALAAQLLHPGRIAVAFFGDGAMNQGMLLESLNLAVAWKLPDKGWREPEMVMVRHFYWLTVPVLKGTFWAISCFGAL